MAVTVPIEPTVQRQGLQTGSLRRVSPGTGTQAAQQLQTIGQTLTQQAGVLNEVAVKQQQERNTSQVLSAKTAFDAQSAERLTEARNAQGTNAWGVTKRTGEWWDKTTSEHIDNMENEAQKTALRRIFDEKWPATKANLYSHEIGQQRKAVNDSAKASIQAASDLAVANHNDPNLVNQAIADISRTVKVQQATNEGWSDEVSEAARMSHLTALHKSVIDAKLDENPKAAEAYYQKHKDQIRGTDRPAIEDGLATGKRIRQSQEFADKMNLEGKTEEEQIAAARKKFEGEDEAEAIAEVTRRFSQREAALSRSQEAANREINDMLFEGATYDMLPSSKVAKLSPAMQQKIRDPNYGKITDPTTYRMLTDMHQRSPEEFAQLSLGDFDGQLNATDRKHFANMKSKAAANPKDPKLGRTRGQIMSQGAAGVGLDPKDATKDSTSGKKVRAYYDRIDAEAISIFETTGKPATDKDIRDIADRLSIEVIETGWVWDSTLSAGTIEIEGVPSDLIPELAESVQATGIEVSDENILKLYNYLIEPR